jgi:hypothetical protein
LLRQVYRLALAPFSPAERAEPGLAGRRPVRDGGLGGNADVAMAAQSSGSLVMTSIDSSDVVDFYSEALGVLGGAGRQPWSQTRITGISFPMDTPANAADWAPADALSGPGSQRHGLVAGLIVRILS